MEHVCRFIGKTNTILCDFGSCDSSNTTNNNNNNICLKPNIQTSSVDYAPLLTFIYIFVWTYKAVNYGR